MGLFDTIRDAVGRSSETEAEPDDDGSDGSSDGAGHTTGGPELVEVRSLGPTTFRQQAEAVVETADPLSFSPESLSRLDTAIAEQYGGHEPAPGDGVYTERAAKLGSYLGELLVREYDGEWTRDDGWGVTVTGTNGQVTVAVFDVAAHSLTEQPVFETVPERLEEKLRFEGDAERPADDRGAASDAGSTSSDSDGTQSDDSGPDASPDGPTRVVSRVSSPDGEQPAATAAGDDPTRVVERVSAADEQPAAADAEGAPTRVVERVSTGETDPGDAEPATTVESPGQEPTDAEPTRVVRRVDEPAETAREDGSDEAEPAALPDAEPTRVVERVETPGEPDESDAGAVSQDAAPTPVVSRVEDDADTGSTASEPTRVVRRVDAASESDPDAGSTHDEVAAAGPDSDDASPEPTRVVRRVADAADDQDPTRVVRRVESDDTDDGPPARADSEPTRVVRRVTAPEDGTSAGPSPAPSRADTGDETPSAADGPGNAVAPTDETETAAPDPEKPPEHPRERADVGADDPRDGDGRPGVVPDTETATDDSVEADAGATGADAGRTDDADDPVDDGTRADAGGGPAGGGDATTFEGVRAEYADRAADFADFWSERDLDFSRDSLGRLDALVGDQWADERFDDATFDSDGSFDDRVFASVATELGSYFGEVLVRTLDGEWTDETDHRAVVVVDGPAGPLAVPVFQVATNSLRETAVFARSYDALVADLGREP